MMTNGEIEWNNTLCIKFLNIYEKEPCVWNPEHTKYKHRKTVTDAWHRIKEQMGLEFSVSELKKKRDSLMATFRPLFRKVKAAAKMNKDELIYRPGWFAYETMEKFLKIAYQPQSPSNSINSIYDMEDSIELQQLSDTDKDNECDNDRHSNINADPMQLYKEPTISNISRKRYIIDESQINAQTITNNNNNKNEKNNNNNNYNNYNNNNNNCNNINKQLDRNVENYCKLYANLLVNKLIAFDDITREYVMNDIDNLIFKYKLNSQNSQLAEPIHVTTCQSSNCNNNIPTKSVSSSSAQSRNVVNSFNKSTPLFSLQDLIDPINIKTSPISSPDISI